MRYLTEYTALHKRYAHDSMLYNQVVKRCIDAAIAERLECGWTGCGVYTSQSCCSAPGAQHLDLGEGLGVYESTQRFNSISLCSLFYTQVGSMFACCSRIITHRWARFCYGGVMISIVRG